MPYPCQYCSVVPETIGSSIRHQRFHAKSQRTFTFFCPVLDCNFQSASYAGIDYHVSANHRDLRHVDPEATEQLFCNVDCNNCFFSTTSLVLLVKHLFSHLEVGCNVMCPIDGCSNSFQKKSAFRVHLPIYHKHWADEGYPKQSLKRIPVHDEQNLFSMDFEDNDPVEGNRTQFEGSNHSDDNENVEVFDDELFMATIGKFYLSLYAEKLLAQTTIQDICNSITYMTEVSHARMKVILTRALRDLEIPEGKIDRICYDVLQSDLLYTSHHKNSPGPSLTSHHLRKKIFKEKFGYFGPTEINLDEDDPNSEKKLQYIPVKKSLSVLLQDPSIQKEIEASFFQQQENGITVSDYQDGTLFQSENHPQSEIQLLLYQDSSTGPINVVRSPRDASTLSDLPATLQRCAISQRRFNVVRSPFRSERTLVY
ncbi:Zinc finger protein 202 [Frankliniella fusca]|uniref:Zinc finger protein 202 n=1 Tax=Frankliniella fusca TaxID=407009 RepID=A0AAE1LJW0_9NEOP|nr:Zinc finger protein 202 [Frankliniella fusca]